MNKEVGMLLPKRANTSGVGKSNNVQLAVVIRLYTRVKGEHALLVGN